MIKQFSILAGLAMTTYSASAATIVFSFGADAPSNTQTVSRVATTGATGGSANVTVADVRDTTNNSTGMSTTATGTQWFSAGGPGSFTPVGTIAYTPGNAVVDGWATTYLPANVGNIWQQGANGDTNPGGTNATSSLTFTGLAANTSYTYKLLSVRANGFLTDSGTYAMTYNGVATGVTTTFTGAGTLTGNSVAGSATGNASGLNAREINWSFTTGAAPGDAVLNLTGDWNVNAILINSVPEPTSALLGGLGCLALLRRRRK